MERKRETRFGGSKMSQKQKDCQGGGKKSRGFDNPNGTTQKQKDCQGGGKKSRGFDNPNGTTQKQKDCQAGGSKMSQKQKDYTGGGIKSCGYDREGGPTELQKKNRGNKGGGLNARKKVGKYLGDKEGDRIGDRIGLGTSDAQKIRNDERVGKVISCPCERKECTTQYSVANKSNLFKKYYRSDEGKACAESVRFLLKEDTDRKMQNFKKYLPEWEKENEGRKKKKRRKE
jgi:hypothetical protein